MAYNSENIENKEIQYFYDYVLQKITKEIQNHPPLSEDLYLANMLFQKFKIQFYSVMQLTYKMTHNPNNQYEYLDIASIKSIIRSAFETFLIFEYIFMQSKNMEIRKLRMLLYKLHGYKDAKKIFNYNTNEYKEYHKKYRETKDEIQRMEVYCDFSSEIQNKLIFENWKPSW